MKNSLEDTSTDSDTQGTVWGSSPAKL